MQELPRETEAAGYFDEWLAHEHSNLHLLDTIFEAAPVAIAFCDRELRYVRVNEIAAGNFGRKPSEMIGHTPEEVIPGSMAKLIAAGSRQVLETGEPLVGQATEAEVPPGSGRFKHWLSNRYPVRNERGTVIGVATIAADVTALRKVQSDLVHMLALEQEARGQLEAARRELAELNEQLSVLASTDPLTGLANRMNLLEHVSLALARANRSGAAVGAVYVDLDRFKVVNDRFGHGAGDELLRAVAGRLRSAARGSDLLARLGGDEFLILLCDLDLQTPEESALAVAARIRATLSEPFGICGVELRISASIGISIYPLDASDERSLLEKADAAMYEAKRSKQPTVVAHAPIASFG